MRALAFVLALALLPVAQAASQAEVLFLADADVPAGDGQLQTDWPEGNVSSARIILPEPAGATFVVAQPNTTHLKGPVFVALWPDKAMAEDGSRLRAWLDVGGERVLNGSVPVHFDPSSVPDPMSFVPADPTDPAGAAMHIVAQALPLVLTPPVFVMLGHIDVEVPEGTQVSLGLALEPGGALPGGSVLVKYDSLLTPSYVYMPWWTPEPARGPVAPPPLPSTPTVTPTPTEGPEPTEAKQKESPAPLAAGLAALAWLAWRRR